VIEPGEGKGMVIREYNNLGNNGRMVVTKSPVIHAIKTVLCIGGWVSVMGFVFRVLVKIPFYDLAIIDG